MRRDQILARRRIAVRVGLGALVVLTATACIFEQSDYQGGGRVDRGGEAKTAEPTATAPQPTATSTATATNDGSIPNPFPDAGDGG